MISARNLMREVLRYKRMVESETDLGLYTSFIKTVLKASGVRISNDHYSPNIASLVNSTKRLIDELIPAINNHTLFCNFIEKNIRVLREMPREKLIILSDNLSLQDALFIISKIGLLEDFLVSINPSGKTSTYKFLISKCSMLTNVLPGLRDVGGYIAKNTGSSYIKVNIIDKTLHKYDKVVFNGIDEVAEAMFEPLNKLLLLINKHRWRDILLICDHGYDVIKYDTDRYILRHKLVSGVFSMSTLCISLIIPRR